MIKKQNQTGLINSLHPLFNIMVWVLLFLMSCKNEPKKTTTNKKPKPEAIIKNYGLVYNNYIVKTDTLKSGDTFGSIINQFTLKDSLTPQKVTNKIADSFNLKNIRAGKEIITFANKKNKKQLDALVYVTDKTNYLLIDLRDSVSVKNFKTPIILKTRTVAAALDGSLSETLQKNNVNPSLASQLTQIYKYSIDFFKSKKGDKFAVTITEKFSANGDNLGVENVLASYFEYRGKKIYSFPYQLKGNKTEYFDEKASGSKAMFLKAPLDYFSITSKFSRQRFHPVQLRWKAHNGTDYAAPHGTPIKSTATGRVEQTGYTAGNGNFVKVKHSGNYSTQYLHMSKILVKHGQPIAQGQVIGRVGATGLTTGPHVCYRFWKNGVQVDPLKLKLPVSSIMSPQQKANYLATITPLKTQLDKATIVLQSK